MFSLLIAGKCLLIGQPPQEPEQLVYSPIPVHGPTCACITVKRDDIKGLSMCKHSTSLPVVFLGFTATYNITGTFLLAFLGG